MTPGAESLCVLVDRYVRSLATGIRNANDSTANKNIRGCKIVGEQVVAQTAGALASPFICHWRLFVTNGGGSDTGPTLLAQ